MFTYESHLIVNDRIIGGLIVASPIGLNGGGGLIFITEDELKNNWKIQMSTWRVLCIDWG